MNVRRLTLTGVLLIAAVMVAGANATRGARTAVTSFHLVFDGKHNAALLHEGLFTTSASFCSTGSAADVSIDSSTETSTRRFSCGSAGDFTAQVTPLPAEHGGIGSWQIVDGSGSLANLRGKGTWTSTRLSGRLDDPATITFRSTWDGVADFDVSPPTVGVSSSSARKLSRPKGAYTLRVVLSLSDGEGNLVVYSLQVVDPRKPVKVLAYKVGQTRTGSATSTVRLKPAKRTRILQLKIDASDALGNAAALVKTVRLK